jgi:hypothetical protein
VSRTFFFAALALSAAIVIPFRRLRSEEYVGIDHPAGELRLSLGSGGRFVLTLALWDPVVGMVVSRRELAGRWRRAWGVLELHASDRRLTYRGSQRRGVGWVWQRSDLPTFADGIALVPVPPSSTG